MRYGLVVSVLACELRGWWFGSRGRQIFFFLKICFWSVNRDPVLRICHRPVWQSVKVCHSKQFTDSQKQICNRPETESVCYLGIRDLENAYELRLIDKSFLKTINFMENTWLLSTLAKTRKNFQFLPKCRVEIPRQDWRTYANAQSINLRDITLRVDGRSRFSGCGLMWSSVHEGSLVINLHDIHPM
jgi:hypothetical protein